MAGPAYSVGQEVAARRAGNRIGNFVPATVTAVNELPIDAGSNMFFAEKVVCLACVTRCLTGNRYPEVMFSYDVKYDNDGETETNLPQDSLQPAPPSAQQQPPV